MTTALRIIATIFGTLGTMLIRSNPFAGVTFYAFALAALISSLFTHRNDEILKKQAEDTKIVISPARMAFWGAAFSTKDRAMRSSEQYEFSVRNISQKPLYNVWVELSSPSIYHHDIVVIAKDRPDAQMFPGLPIRLDTSGLAMKYTSGQTCVLLAICKIAPQETYEYLISLNPREPYSGNVALDATLIRSSEEATPLRSDISTESTEIMFPAPLPRSGEILRFIYFNRWPAS